MRDHTPYSSVMISNFIEELLPADSDTVEKIRERMRLDQVAHLSLSRHEVAVLRALIHWHQPQRIMEIGTLYGATALSMAEAAPLTAEVWSIEKDSRRWRIAQDMTALSPASPRLKLLLGDARKLLSEISESFDFIFIDANKSAYSEYWQWASQHVNTGGFIVVDNTWLMGAVFDQHTSMAEATKDNQAGASDLTARCKPNRARWAKHAEKHRAWLREVMKNNAFAQLLLPTQAGMLVSYKKPLTRV